MGPVRLGLGFLGIRLGLIGIAIGRGGVSLSIRLGIVSFVMRLFGGRGRGRGKGGRGGGSGSGGGAPGGPSGSTGSSASPHGGGAGSGAVALLNRMTEGLRRAEVRNRERRDALREERRSARGIPSGDEVDGGAPRDPDASSGQAIEDDDAIDVDSAQQRRASPEVGTSGERQDERSPAEHERARGGLPRPSSTRESRQADTRKEREARAAKRRSRIARRSATEPVTPPPPRDAGGTDRGSARREFNLAGQLPHGFTILEASAGTGKTYALTALVARFVAEEGLESEELLMVTFTRAAAAEMRTRTLEKLVEARAAMESGDPGPHDWLRQMLDCDEQRRRERTARLDRAIVDFDAAVITTIHGFCQWALQAVGVRAGELANGEIGQDDSAASSELLRDRLVQIMSVDPSAFGDIGGLKPNEVESSLTQVIRAATANQGSVLAPAGRAVGVEGVWRDTAASIIEAARARRMERGAASFDDLVIETDRMVGNPTVGPQVVQMMRDRFRLVLIDEFQDTDTAQWRIFNRLFVAHSQSRGAEDPPPTVVCVGDPKQAIYRFRGADIDAYLRAASTGNAEVFTMRRNFRTDRALVGALNALMDGADFGRGRVPYVTVEAQQTGRALETRPPFEVRWLAQGGATDGANRSADETRRRIADDVAEHVVDLLTNHRLADGTNRGLPPRRLVPGDIAILLRANGDAEHIVRALGARGVPSVQNKIGSVVASDAMQQLRLLFNALERPHDVPRVRALMLGWFVRWDVGDAGSPEFTVGLQRRCEDWATALQRKGVAGFFEGFRSEDAILDGIAATGELDRHMTDLQHLVEILHRETKGALVSPSALLRTIEVLQGEGSEREEHLRRTETDAAAVQIMSMHGSKGLEFPVVLLPYPKGANNDAPYVYTRGDSRNVDAAPRIDWSSDGLNQAGRKQLAAAEIAEDERRLIYVALTRAKHHLAVWWGTSRGVEKGALAGLLFRSHGEAVSATAPKSDPEQLDALKSLQSRIGPAMSLTEIGDEVGATAYVPDADPGMNLAVLQIPNGAVADEGWRRWSYSSMKKVDEEKAGEPERQRGGKDEGAEAETGVVEVDTADAEIPGELLSMPRGTAFGTMVHDVLEHCDFRAPSLESELRSVIERRHGEEPGGCGSSALARGLCAVIQTPLDGLVDGFRLADLGKSERLDEFEFHLLLADGRRRLPLGRLAAEAARNEPGHVQSYFASLAETWRSSEASGLLYGSIDAFLRFGNRYFVVDYKTNALHPRERGARIADYSTGRMSEEMGRHSYYLQALIYTVAAHRFLRARLRGYDPSVNLGGAGYLFVRAMVGPDTHVVNGVRCGVHSWRPSLATIEAVDRLLDGDVP